LARLPDEAIVVNVGRGALIDEAALYEALKSDRLHAAALDVWYHYPPDKESRAATMPAETPLHELDNVVFSPHRSAALHADGGERLRLKALADLLTAAVRGEPLPNRVDLARGY
jgi:phosphoglycerate dehydrogenase-like enzyme